MLTVLKTGNSLILLVLLLIGQISTVSDSTKMHCLLHFVYEPSSSALLGNYKCAGRKNISVARLNTPRGN